MWLCRAVTWAREIGGCCYFKTQCPSTSHHSWTSLRSARLDTAEFERIRQSRETASCTHGSGEGYYGDVAVTAHGLPFKAGTFCRNDGSQSQPFCETEDGHVQHCSILACERAFGGRFAGSRGAIHEFQYKRSRFNWINTPERFYGKHVLSSTFMEKGSHTWLTGRHNHDQYIGRQTFVFITPRDGAFRFFVLVDDFHELIWYKKDGSYEIPYITLGMTFEEGNGGDYGVVGV